jgi:hypothetical protein
MSNQKEAKVANVWVTTEVGREWRFEWRRRFFVWEEELLNNMMEVLHGHVWTEGVDKWVWRLEDGGSFTVKSAYNKLISLESHFEVMGEEEGRVFGQIWESPAPSKVVAFSWKVILNRIPTRINLARRNVLPENGSLNCVLCDLVGESESHLFFALSSGVEDLC